MNNYERFDEVGRNNMAVLYEGHDKASNRDVVIMELHPQLRANQSGWQAVWDDVQVAFNAPLENTVERHALLNDGEIIVQMIPGNLLDRLHSERRLDPNIVRSAMRRALHALETYEEAGIIHGCVKPASLVHNHLDYIKLSFSPGLKLGGQITEPCCDFKYMAPELIESRFGEIGPGVDLYAIGITALELILGDSFAKLIPGVRTLNSTNDERWTQWHTSEEIEVPGLAEVMPSVPDDLARVIDRLTQRNVADRYASASEAVADLNDGEDVKLDVKDDGRRHQLDQKDDYPAKRPDSRNGRKSGIRDGLQNLMAQARDPRNRKIVSVAGIVVALLIAMLLIPGSENTLVTINSEPSGAIILINDKPVADSVTPKELRMPPGQYTLSLLKDGFLPLQTTFVVETSPKLEVGGALERESRKVTVNSVPKGATVRIGEAGNQPKTTPATLQITPGEYQLTLSLDGFKTMIVPLTVAQGTSPLETEIYSLIPDIRLPDGLVPVDGSPLNTKLVLPKAVYHAKTNLQFVLIESRRQFSCGVRPSDGDLQPGELEAVTRDVDVPFFISVTEVSAGQFDQFRQSKNEGTTAGEGDPELPAVQVSFRDALAFCEWVSPSGRLPTEVEWELVAGDGTRMQPWQNEALPDASHCNLQFDPAVTTTLRPVNSMQAGATPTGVKNMLGNVAEWCLDIYAAGHDEADGDPGVGAWHAIRGGGFMNLIVDPKLARVTMRSSAAPAGGPDIGFRVVIPVQVGVGS